VGQYEAGRWIELADDGVRFLRELDFAWPGNVRHLEHLAARLAMERPQRPVGPRDLLRLLDISAALGSAQGDGAGKPDLEIGLPALLAQEEKKWLQEALTHHPNLTRAGLAAKLKISEAALYKKLKQYQLGR
jgi:DNA-binding NtrC family response regulator